MMNNIDIVKLLLQYNPNVNLLLERNTGKLTTMHIAAMHKNVSMMKLLIQHGFNCDKFINNIYYTADHLSVFLQLCFNGNVECMDYLMNQCKNKVDIWQRSINGWNGLHLAVANQHLSMVKYLCDNVYKNDEMKRKIFNQTIGINGTHISSLAAERGTTQDGLSIFRLLRQNKCPIHRAAILYAADYSSLILQYMLNEQLYPNYIYLSNDLIRIAIKNAQIHLVHKNVLIVVEYLRNMKDSVSIHEYKKWIINIFYSIMMHGTMDGYFKMLKEMIELLLNDNDWKCFIQSKIIDRNLLVNVQEKINNPTNTTDIVDDKWCLLLERMIDSFDDGTLLNKYQEDSKDAEEEKEKERDDSYYCIKENHLMIEMKCNDMYSSNTKSNKNKNHKCNYCNKLYDDLNSLSFECIECEEYICKECINNLIMLIHYLKNEQFEQFDAKMKQYNEEKQEKMVQQVELYRVLSSLHNYWM